MTAPRRFKVIIAGGSVGGLTLANALERAGIDYILLEKRDVAPDLGASITSLPCTSLVHEQLSVAQPIKETTVPLHWREHYDEKGRMFSSSGELKILTAKATRPMIWMERRFYLESLYAGIADKSKIRTREGVVSYTENEHGVVVTTDNGEKVDGSILVGVDGIHSTIRTLIAEEIREKDPAAAKNLIEGFTARYRTLFGTSRNDPDHPFMADGVVHNVYYRGVGGIASAGVPGLIFWFMYLPLDPPAHTPKIPRYTEADCEEAIAKNGHLQLGQGYTFRDLWTNRIRAGMAPMEEGVLKAKWNNGGRVVLLGDAVHKSTVNLGLGGNTVVDGVCNLLNELLPLLQRPDAELPTAAELSAVFDRYEAKQRPRANYCVNMSGLVTRLETMETWWLRLLRYLLPWIPESVKAGLFLDFDKTAPTLGFLPHPDKKSD